MPGTAHTVSVMSSASAPPSRGGDHRRAAVAQLRAVYGIGQAAAAASTDDDLLQFTAAAWPIP